MIITIAFSVVIPIHINSIASRKSILFRVEYFLHERKSAKHNGTLKGNTDGFVYGSQFICTGRRSWRPLEISALERVVVVLSGAINFGPLQVAVMRCCSLLLDL
jgi:hypothetical protein